MKKISIPLSDQVVSLKVAKELNEALKKAGIEVEGNCWWLDNDLIVKISEGHYRRMSNILDSPPVNWDDWGKRSIPTYTTDEMLAVLPNEIYIEDRYSVDNVRKRYYFNMRIPSIYPSFGYSRYFPELNYDRSIVCEASSDKVNPATAIAKLVIWCANNGYLGGEEG